MAKKKKTEPTPKRQPDFKTDSFAALKGLAVKEPVREEPLKPVKPQQAPARDRSADELFRQAMAGVRPLESQAKAVAHTADPARSKRPAPAPQSPSEPPQEELSGNSSFLLEVEKLKLDVRFEDQIPGEEELLPLSGNRLRQVKRGIISLDRQLDLHGLTRDEALDALAGFLKAARQAGEKGALVITGKGNRSAEGPVLQQAVAAWLREQGRTLVLEYAPAPQVFGGSGAFVVFLRPLDK